MIFLTKTEAIKKYFGNVTSKELIEFRKADKEGYEELGELALQELNKTE